MKIIKTTNNDSNEKLIEELSKLEHDQWMFWAKSILESEDISEDRKKRWKKLFIPYSELSAKDKDDDREWANKVFKIIKQNK